MSSLFIQSAALSRANLKSLSRRKWISLSMVMSVALVVTVLLGFLAMANGFRTALLGAGSDDIAIVLGSGAATELGSQIETAQLHLIGGLPGIAQTAAGQPIISPELVVPVDATVKSSGLFETLSLAVWATWGCLCAPP
jgi:putative ABC transport system permease protein